MPHRREVVGDEFGVHRTGIELRRQAHAAHRHQGNGHGAHDAEHAGADREMADQLSQFHVVSSHNQCARVVQRSG
jgi:hypothetical protein